MQRSDAEPKLHLFLIRASLASVLLFPISPLFHPLPHSYWIEWGKGWEATYLGLISVGDSWERKGADGSSGWTRLPAILSHGCLLPRIINPTQSWSRLALYPRHRNSNVILHSRVCVLGGGAMLNGMERPSQEDRVKTWKRVVIFMCHFIPTTCLKKKAHCRVISGVETPRRGVAMAL